MKTNITDTLTLLRKDCTTIAVTFENSLKHYVYKALKKDNFQVGDTAIVSVSGVLKLVLVREVHDRPRLNPANGSFSYKWVVQKVDKTQYTKCIEQERAFEEMLLDAERTRIAEEMRDTLIARFGLADEKVEALRLFLEGSSE